MLNWGHRYRLSRFTLLRPSENGFVLESPLTNLQFPVRGVSVLRILDVLSRPVRPEALLAGVEEAQRPALRALLESCYQAGFLTRVYEDGSSEEENSSLSHWEFHDLLFHTSSRLGRNRHPIGGTYRLKNRVFPEPAKCMDPSSEKRVVLPRPDPAKMKGRDFHSVLERRRSAYGRKPLNITALGEFLYETCRITETIGTGDEAAVHKVYPSGGSLHPLRVYVAMAKCEGCAPGLYVYLDGQHALSPIRGLDGSVERILSDARDSAGGLPENPPALFIISAIFRRTAWKYESIAYRLILLEAGALFQTMYLVATAMDLKACALGCGDSDHFARTIGSDYYTESSIGEFLLGS